MTARNLDDAAVAAGLDHPAFCWYHGFESVCDIHETRPVRVSASAGDVVLGSKDTGKGAYVESSASKTLRGVYGTHLSAVDTDGRRVNVEFTVDESIELIMAMAANVRLALAAKPDVTALLAALAVRP